MCQEWIADQLGAIRVVAVKVGVYAIEDGQGQSAADRHDCRNLPAVQCEFGKSVASPVVVELPDRRQVEHLPYIRVGASLFGRQVVIVLGRNRSVLNTFDGERLAPDVVGSQAKPVVAYLSSGDVCIGESV